MPRLTRDRLVQLGRFLVVGVASAITDIGGLYLLHAVVGMWLPLAAATSFLASFAVNFTLNRRWTFDAQAGATGGQLVRFTVLVAINTVLTSVGVTAITGLGLNFMVAKLIVVVVVTAANFVVLRLWVFRQPARPAADPADGADGVADGPVTAP